MKRGVKVLGGLLLGIVVSLTLIVGWLAKTENGLQWLGRQAQPWIKIEELSGTLAQLDFKNLQYQGDGLSLVINSGRLQWQPQDLLRGVLAVNDLQINQLNIDVVPGDKESDSKAFSGIELPVNIRLENSSVNGLSYSSNGSEVLQLKTIMLAAGVQDNLLLIDTLQLVHDQAQLKLAGGIDLANTTSGQINLNESGYLRTAQADYKFAGNLRGSWAQLQLVQSVSAPFKLELSADIKSPLQNNIAWQAELTAQDIAPGLWWPDTPFENLAGKIVSAGSVSMESGLSMADWQLDAGIAATSSSQGSWDFELESHSESGDLFIDALQINEKARDANAVNKDENTPAKTAITVNGVIRELKYFLQPSEQSSVANNPAGRQTKLQGEWQDLRWPLGSSDSEFQSERGSFDITGVPDAYQLQASADLVSRQLPAAQIELAGSGNRSSLQLHTISMKSDGSTLAGKSKVNWSPDISWDSSLTLRDFNPAMFVADWPGKLSATILTEGRVAPDAGSPLKLVGNLGISGLRGELREKAISGQVDIDADTAGLVIKTARLRLGESRLSVSGTVGNSHALEWNLESPSLNDFFPGGSGVVNANGRASGPLKEPLVTANINASEVAYQQWSLGSLQSKVTVDLGRGSNALMRGEWAGNVELSTLKQDGRVLINRSEAKLTGTANDHNLLISAIMASDASINLELDGDMSDQHWQGRLMRLDIANATSGDWQLAQPSQLKITAASIVTEEICLQAQTQSACTRLAANAQQTNFQTKITNLQLAQFNQRLKPYELALAGTTDLDISFDKAASADSATIDGSLATNGARVTFRYPESEDTEGELTRTFEIEALNLDIQQHTSLQASVDLQVKDAGSISGSLTAVKPLNQTNYNTAALVGRLETRLGDLSILPPALLSGTELKGAMTSTINLAGSFDSPELGMKLDLADATARIDGLGVLLQDIKVQLTSKSDSVVGMQASLRSGEGLLELQGELDFTNLKSPRARLDMQGEAITLIQNRDMFAVGDIDASIRMNQKDLDIQGSLLLSKAEIDFGKTQGVELASPDVTLEANEQGQAPLRTTMNLDVDFGEKTHLRAIGVDTGLVGKLKISQRAGGLVTGRGRIETKDGYYEAYGERLNIDKGSLIFSGTSIDDPSLELDAAKQVDDIRAGVRVRGTAQAPRIDLFSEPVMSDQDILSVLVFNKPVDKLGSQDGLALLKIATVFQGGGDSRITQLTDSLQNTLGLTDLELQVAGGKPSISLGKKISSNFYIGYGYGLLDAAQSLILRYQLSKTWSIQGDLGENNGADIRYQIER